MTGVASPRIVRLGGYEHGYVSSVGLDIWCFERENGFVS